MTPAIRLASIFFVCILEPLALLTAQTAKQVSRTQDAKLRLVVYLSRHGVRPSTWTEDRLNAYAAQPWPQWSVPPGYLTPHGYDLLKLFGGFDRAALSKTGLIAAEGCVDAAKTYIWADTDERTLKSGHALAEGLFPGCPPVVESKAAGERDPLFHPGAGRPKPGRKDPAGTEQVNSVDPHSEAQQNELLSEMQHVLLGCSPADSCTPAHDPAIPLLGGGPVAAGEKGDPGPEANQPLALGASFAEDFLLEYAEGMPSGQVGWGNVDELQVRRFMTLHTEHTEQTDRTPDRARMQASNLLFHIERTLEQGVEGRAVEDAVGNRDSKIVILVGHDTNIAGVAALLGLHWTLDGRTDDTPPGTELAFELWQNDCGTYTVRVTVSMQTLRQMRETKDLTPAAPPAREVLTLKGCGAGAVACGWNDFVRIVDSAIDMKSVVTERRN